MAPESVIWWSSYIAKHESFAVMVFFISLDDAQFRKKTQAYLHSFENRTDLRRYQFERIEDWGKPPQTELWDAVKIWKNIPWILDPAKGTLSWDPRDLGSRTGKILLDPGDPGSSLSRLSWDLADLGSYKTLMSCILNILYIEWNFSSGSPYLCAAQTWALIRISTTHWFNHSVLT